MKVIITLIKSLFKCQHFASDLTVLSQDNLYKQDEDFDYYECTCECKCGAAVKHNFAFINLPVDEWLTSK